MRLELVARSAGAAALCLLLGCMSTGVVGMSPDAGAAATCDGPAATCATTCNANANCSGKTPVCAAGRCVQCALDADCAKKDKPFCSANQCVECLKGSDCSGDAPLCVDNKCRQCTATADCGHDPQKPYCDVVSLSCVQCLSNAECGPAEPRCMDGKCQQCAMDADCGHDQSCQGGVCETDTGDHGAAGNGGT